MFIHVYIRYRALSDITTLYNYIYIIYKEFTL